MTLKLDKAEQQRLVASIRRYCTENLEPVGDLQASLLLDFFVQEAGPAIYNQAVADAQARLMHHVSELPAECYELEGDYWAKVAAAARPASQARGRKG